MDVDRISRASEWKAVPIHLLSCVCKQIVEVRQPMKLGDKDPCVCPSCRFTRCDRCSETLDMCDSCRWDYARMYNDPEHIERLKDNFVDALENPPPGKGPRIPNVRRPETIAHPNPYGWNLGETQ